MEDLLGVSVDRQLEPKSAARAAGRTPILAPYVNGPMKLRGRFKRETLHATVRRDGIVHLNGRLFTSPSLAAAVACKVPTCNGWIFWQYERAPGDWVLLDELRK
jgi:hypothetical protein